MESLARKLSNRIRATVKAGRRELPLMTTRKQITIVMLAMLALFVAGQLILAVLPTVQR
jgi:hypothetical protein